MAEKSPLVYPMPEIDEYDNYEEYREAEEAAMEELKNDPNETIVYFQVADGYARYRLKSKEPLVLQHIPYGDKYRIPDPHLRGLRLEDIEQKLDSEFDPSE
jgi:hypothetical protein